MANTRLDRLRERGTEPFEVKCPNKIRKRIAMHETDSNFLERLESTTLMKKILSLPSKPVAKKQGSLWSRFTSRVKNLLK